MSQSPKLGLPYLEMSQAQKEITHNEALLRLDALVLARALAQRNDPPGDPAEGDLYLLGDSPSGAWAEQAAGRLAAFYGGWIFLEPQPGWRLLEAESGRELSYDGSAWQALPALQVPSLEGGWISYGSGHAGVRYRRDIQGRVTIEGAMQEGSDGPVFTLLEGYRPAETLVFAGWAGTAACRLEVQAGGLVTVSASDSVFTSLSGVSFYAAA